MVSGRVQVPNSYDRKKEKDLKIYEALEADKVINAYGVFGRYQLFGYCLCQCLNFFYASSVYVMPYIQLNPTLLCMYQNKSIAVDDSCWITERNLSLIGQCGVINGTRLIIIDSTPVTSLIKEFELTCGKYIWKEAGLSIFTIGAVLTVPFMSNLADQYGRKPIVLTAIFVAFLANVASTFAPSFWIFLALRFIVGAASDTYASVCGILTCELISSKCRAWITLVYTLAWTCGMFWVGFLSLFITKWRMMYLINSAPGIFGVLYYLWNNTTINLHECQRVAEREVSSQQTARDLCGSRTMLKYLCINGFIQFVYFSSIHLNFIFTIFSFSNAYILKIDYLYYRFVMSLYYFALSFMSIDLSKDRFTAYMLSAFIEIPDWSRFVGVAACCVLAAGLTCFLPETKDCDMPTDIQSLVHEGMISGEVDGRQMLMSVSAFMSSDSNVVCPLIRIYLWQLKLSAKDGIAQRDQIVFGRTGQGGRTEYM
uniref:MFS domain-containing protein n=1 Tax=Heterorhabditis bacteriophora TaxID=37862 RepID=A0A1I7XIL7_HETBA